MIALLVKIASEALGLSEEELKKAWDGRTYEDLARVEWKFAVSKAIVGTPGIMLNGVVVQNVPTSADEMLKTFSAYIAPSTPTMEEV